MLVHGLHEVGTAVKAQRPASSVLRVAAKRQTALPPPDAEADAKPRDTHEGSDAKPLSDQEKDVGVDDGFEPATSGATVEAAMIRRSRTVEDR
jgi:hypothetical protein